MSLRSKKIFFILSVAVPFLLYCVYYYGMMVKNAPYKFAEFQSFTIEYGYRDSLFNKYNSETGAYQFVNKKDSIVKKKLWLTKDDLLYLHRKAAELGYWDFPSNEIGDTTKKHVPRFIVQFNYKRKSKRVIYYANYDGHEKLRDANERLIKEIQGKLTEASARYDK
ncbi:hypothetical protein DYU05_04780 [Mucilaginibacter terrenus]|uniref:Uncharacterized protein n=1 Tax=Mucilaginibacter terrenus TaxID=2482727 RepID=A0A3E2NV82_9SPHI|nr:hypothetical protein [Mucilaginibacter terrenus]RFZ84924.1 hypothetical protein DYU05_04780 [Mucilaginibacter terrenus]